MSEQRNRLCNLAPVIIACIGVQMRGNSPEERTKYPLSTILSTRQRRFPVAEDEYGRVWLLLYLIF
jgi:hypothetical protein